MINLLSLEKSTGSFQVSIGEEGAVIVYLKQDKLQNRLFVRTTEPHDTVKLMQLLVADPKANIKIYLDTLDQSFVQRQIPGVNAFSVNQIARNRLNREIPSTYLKTALQIKRLESGRKDWVYTFVAAAYEPPLSKWIEFFLPYPNIIEGIYFLAVEIALMLPHLREKKPIFQTKSIFRSALSLATKVNNDLGWEIFICQNKTGGLRQVAFLNEKIIFSRLLNNVAHTDLDVMAGNIEQEIANSIEYLSRLAMGMEENISIYIILTHEVLKFIRPNKIKAKNITLFTPYQVATKLSLENVATEKDKFFDPVLLTYLAGLFKPVRRLHIDNTKQVYNAGVLVSISRRLLNLLMPIWLIVIGYNVFEVVGSQFSIAGLKDKIENFSVQISKQTSTINTISNEVQGGLLSKHISEIVDLDKFMHQTDETPIEIALKLSEALPDYARVKSYRWNYYDNILYNFKPTKRTNPTNITQKRNFEVTANLEVLFTDYAESYEKLSSMYTSFKEIITQKFPYARVTVSNLPSSFNFQGQSTKVILDVKIKYENK